MQSKPSQGQNKGMLRPFQILLVIVGLAAAYYATGRAIVVLGAPPNGAVTTIWLPSGITVAAFLRFGPWAAVGSFIGSLALDTKMGTPLAAGVLVACANAGSEYLCYRLIAGGASALRRLETSSLLRLLWSSLLAALTSSSVGVSSYLYFGVIPRPLFFSSALTWFGSTVVGIVLITPCLLMTFEECRTLWATKRRLEYLCALVAVAGAGYMWQGTTLPRQAHEPMVLAVITALLWIAFRFTPAAMPAGIFCFAAASMAGAILRIAREPQEMAFLSIFSLQLMLGGVALFGYFLSSMIAARKLASEKLRLAAKVYDTTTEGVMVTSRGGSLIEVNAAFERITGYSRAECLGRHPSFLKSERHGPAFYQAQVHALLTDGEWQGQVWYRRADGSLFPGWISLSAVRDTRGEITEYVGILSDITELREAQTKLLASARHAGMAEIATNMLHNIGNVLNSVNVSAGRLVSQLHNSKVSGLGRATAMIRENSDQLAEFLLHDAKGRLLPGYLEKLAETLNAEQQETLEELGRITRSIDHIKDIVATQQSYAGTSTVVEMVQVAALVEDALRINAESLTRHTVTVVRDFAEVPALLLDKARIMMILVNLIRNAKHAMAKVTDREQLLTLRLRLSDGDAGRHLIMSVQDAGEGIPQENLTRIFAHGFTTKKNGHGFGLHSCAVAAGEMGGTLTAHSEGAGTGATFTLEIPVSR